MIVTADTMKLQFSMQVTLHVTLQAVGQIN